MFNLRRITTGASWIPQIDGLRFVAIFAVVMFHSIGEVHARGPFPLVAGPWCSWLDHMAGNGDRGVSLFFVISGYILARPFLRQHRLEGHPVKVGAYYLRRLTRLEPPYVLSLLINMGSEMIVWHHPFHVMLGHLIASIFYAHNAVFGYMSMISFVTWSLEVEIQFYLLAPLMGSIFRIENTMLRRGVLLASICITGLAAVFYDTGPLYTRLPLFGFLQFFLAGFLLADLLELPRHADNPKWSWDAVSIVGWLLISYLNVNHFSPLLLPFLILPVYVAAFRGKASNWFFRQPFIALTGGMCYSIYLTHMLTISTVFRVVKYVRFQSGSATLFSQTALLALSVFVISPFYFILIERPCMDPGWPQKVWHGLRWRFATK